MMPHRSLFRSALSAVLALAFCAPVAAIPFTTDLTAEASVLFDTVNSQAAINASQSGSIDLRAGGAVTQSLFSDVSLSPTSLAGALTDLGDGVGMHIDLAGDGANATAQNPGLFGDLALMLSNPSATDTLNVTLRLVVAYSELLAQGTDAFEIFDVAMFDGLANEIAFSHRTRDTVNGDVTSDSFFDVFVELLPGESLSFSGVVRGRGGAFTQDSRYSGSIDAYFTIAEVEGGQIEIPAPAAWALLVFALAALRQTRHAPN